MNKETRTWLTGVLIFIIFQYLGWEVININENAFIKAFMWIFCMACASFGLHLILKTIDK